MSSLNQQQQRNLSHSSAALTEKDLETKAADPDNLVYTYTYDKTIPINSATENYHLALLTKKLYNNIKLENPGWCDKKIRMELLIADPNLKKLHISTPRVFEGLTD